MPLKGIIQPEIIQLSDTVRLRKYDGRAELALPGYRDPVVYQNSEGIFDESKIPDLDYVTGMFRYLEGVGEVYFIEVLEGDSYTAAGDVTVKAMNPPIAIWYEQYRGKGIGTLVMKAVLTRLKELGCGKITGSTVFVWNPASLHMHEKLGFTIVSKNDQEYVLELNL